MIQGRFDQLHDELRGYQLRFMWDEADSHLIVDASRHKRVQVELKQHAKDDRYEQCAVDLKEGFVCRYRPTSLLLPSYELLAASQQSLV